MTPGFHLLSPLRPLAALCSCLAVSWLSLWAQEISKKPAERSAEKSKPAPEPENPAQIELLETHIRFETNGDSRKEVHTRVKINNEFGARQFVRINFNYNRAFESVEIPLVHITHPSGGSADILPSAITDQPNPAVVNAPAYQDVRIKSVRILGLEPGDLLEYRVITSVSHHPLAPDFWLDHTFDRSGVVSKEVFDIDLPAARKVKWKINPKTPTTSSGGDIGGIVCATYCTYRWERDTPAPTAVSDDESPASEPDVSLTTFSSWDSLSSRLADLIQPPQADTGGWKIGAEVSQKANVLTQEAATCAKKIEAIYDFVSQKIITVDLPIGSTGFRTRSDSEILSSGYATSEEKFKLFAALARPFSYPPTAFLAGAPESAERQLPRPTQFTRLLVTATDENHTFWLDPSAEVAPFGLIPPSLRGKRALALDNTAPADLAVRYWRAIPVDLPFAALQRVTVDATLSTEGTLTSKVHYALRGDNELLLRVAFHQTPKERWAEVAQLLALSDGFRGKITKVEASDLYATKEPFTVDYEITQPKFIDWLKKPVRIPALLPQIGLPELPSKPASGSAMLPIELGTPLEVEVHLLLHLPQGTTARAPVGASVSRDYATFTSKYSANRETVTATRHVNFLLRELPGERTGDYNSFRRVVQSDEAQDFTLERPETEPAKINSAATDHPAPPKANPQKP